ncbi:cytochrome P450 [Streptomyces sp. NPDC057638]|uniref:cytochrome P450 n=1 Tax=Streptomyces sp. NPDC057638 TaxID=3346190 RepID=UPI0036A3157C
MATTAHPLPSRTREHVFDSTASLLVKGYGWLPDLRRRAGGAEAVPVRLFGHRGVALHGPAAVEFFYDERNVHRADAVPGPVLDTLFGRGAVHTLDGAAHRDRKALFLAVLKDRERIDDLVDRAGAVWDEAAGDRWPGQGRVVLFDEAARILTRAVHDWAGIPLPEEAQEETARDLVAMVDGFAAVGPRHLRARWARKRQEERLAPLIEEIRYAGALSGQATVVQAVAAHRDVDGDQLDPRTGAVELLNVIRPTVAVAWFLTFAAHALHRWPQHRAALTAGGEGAARAFAQEVRRFYPFAPFTGGLAARDTHWGEVPIPKGGLVLLDLYGHHHDPALWPRPYSFDPSRFAGRGTATVLDDLVPQGGGDPATGHRCPGEDITVALLAALAPRLAALPHSVPDQDLSIPLHRVPTRPHDGYVMEPGHPASTRTDTGPARKGHEHE